jgi:hypothetical protein
LLKEIERNVYEQFERMLIDKLNFYVDKHKDANETGGLLHALQLTSEFKNFKKSEHQNGCLFYIPAWNTSKIDPATGFVNLFDTRYTNAEKALEFFRKFDAIRYNEEKDWFEFDVKLRKVWDELNIITPLYDKVRNWLSRKIYNPEKIKLYFENNGKLLSGWSDSQTEYDNGTQYGGYIFRKKNEIGEYDFYLGISADAKLFRRDETICYEDGMYERLDYYNLKPNTLLGNSYIGNYGEDSQFLDFFCPP